SADVCSTDLSQDLEVQPDQRDEEAEGAVPLHVLRGLGAHAVLDEVEVEDEVHRGEADHEQAERDPDGAAVEDPGDPDAEEPETDRHEVDEGHGAGGGDDAELEVLA